MATIQKRKNKNGTTGYRVMIRPNDGLPATYKTFPTYQEAKDLGNPRGSPTTAAQLINLR